MEEFLKHFNNPSKAEQLWLSSLLQAVCERVCPVLDSSAPSPVSLSLAVVSRLQQLRGSEHTHLPVSYRCVSVCELLRDQLTPCCSSLLWSSAHYREQANQAEQMLPAYKALPRDNLLLIGFLCDGRTEGRSQGVWRVRDAGGSVACSMLTSSCLWLGRLMLFPSWNYIPQNAPGVGHLELIDTPVCVTLETMAFDPGGALSEVMSVTRAAQLLRHSSTGQSCVCVSGEVSVVCPLLLICGKRFFCLILSDGGSSVPLFITEAKHQYWRQCVCVGRSVWISALRVCSLQGLEGRRVLTDSEQSRLHTHTPLQETHTPLSSHTPLPESEEEQETHTHLSSDPEDSHPSSHTLRSSHAADTHLSSHTADTHLSSHTLRSSHAADTHLSSIPAVRVKQSTIISFKGTVTKVLNTEAGLYELDGQVGLCLAYQPAETWGGALRPGAELQLHNVHFLYGACPLAPDVVLCACLRSSVEISSFSRCSSRAEASRTHTPLQRLLLEKNLSASQLLWLCYCHSAVSERLCPRWVRAERVPAVAGRLLDCVCDAEQKTQKKRNIYREMIEEPHQCPVTTYCVRWPAEALWSVQQLCDWLRREVWAGLRLSSLLPASACHLTSAELNALLSWSALHLPLARVSSSSSSSLPLLLLGVLELDGTRAVLHLRDQTHAIDCLCVPNISTAWQGCLVCVRRCTLVMERFMKTNFPSWKHLDQPRYITHRHCRLYVQLCVDDLTVISASPSMRVRLSSSSDSLKRPLTPDPCVSLLLRLEVKQAVRLQGASDGHTRRPIFMCRATALGDAQRWTHDPKNCSAADRERSQHTHTVELHFSGVCVRWFPVLHPGCVYRLIALNTEDVSVLTAKDVSARGGVTSLTSPALMMEPQWRIHTLTEEPSDAQSGVPALLSVSDVLRDSSAPEIVSFHGIISQRITVQEDSGAKPKIQSAAKDSEEEELRVRVSVRDVSCAGQMIQVYVDLSCSLYTLGLIEGAHIQIHHVQRRVSRAGNVYCRSLPISHVTVADLGSVCSGSEASPPPPVMLLGEWARVGSPRCIVGQVKGHVVCVLSLRLQWTCSLCGCIFTQTSCGRTHPPCDSTSAVFQAEAKVVVEDGSGEAHVWFSSDSVCDLLMLSALQWEGLQRNVRVKGHVKLYTRGHSMMCDEDPGDALVQYLSCLCSSVSVCRQIHLTCRLRAQRSGKPQLRKFHRGQTEFICKFTPSLQLHCQHIHTR